MIMFTPTFTIFYVHAPRPMIAGLPPSETASSKNMKAMSIHTHNNNTHKTQENDIHAHLHMFTLFGELPLSLSRLIRVCEYTLPCTWMTHCMNGGLLRLRPRLRLLLVCSRTYIHTFTRSTLPNTTSLPKQGIHSDAPVTLACMWFVCFCLVCFASCSIVCS